MHAHSPFLDTSKCKDKSLTKLHIAVIREDVEKVKKYVKKGQEDVNQQVPQKRFKSLLNKEENLVNVRDRYARTPLHLCATNGKVFFFYHKSFLQKVPAPELLRLQLQLLYQQ